MSVLSDTDPHTGSRPGQDAAVLAEQFHAVNDEVIALVESCSAEHWQRTSSDEGWPLAAACMHIAFSHLVITTWVHRMTSGLPMTETPDDFAVVNAYDAVRYAAYEPGRIVHELQLYGAAAGGFVEGLTERELRTVGRLPGLGAEWPIRAVVENILIGHPRTHLASIRAGMADQTPGA